MYTIGYDIGSSSVKVALVETDTGRKIASIHEPSGEMDILAPESQWAEQNPDLWWKYLCKATKRIITLAQIEASKITAIGISYQMHGLVLVDKKGTPLRNAIIWCDSRAVAIGKQAYHDLGHDFCAEHLLNSPGNFTASKLKWVKEHEPDIYEQTYKFMLPGDYIAYKLTGELVTTRNGLSEGILWNYKTNAIASQLLKYYGIDSNLTPTIVDNFSNQGTVSTQGASQTGLPKGIAVTYRSGDQPNNAMALNVLKPGEVAATGGTSGVIYAVSDMKAFNEIRKINHFAHVNYTKETPVVGRLLNINGAGIQYRWLKNNTGDLSYEAMNQKAAAVSIGAEGLVVIPFGNGAERMLDNRTIGTHFCNLHVNRHHQGHLYRATLEGIAFSFVYGMKLLQKDKTAITVIRAGNDNLFRSKIFAVTVATLIGQEIEIYDTTGAVGAARAASIFSGDFEAFGTRLTQNNHCMTYTPAVEVAAYTDAYQRWKKQVNIFLEKDTNGSTDVF